jgi:tripartite ATP-independent transporter DctP family solute receptor
MNKKIKKLTLSIILLVVCILGLWVPVSGAEDPILIRIAFVSPINSDFPYVLAARMFEKEIEEETNGQVQVELFGDGQLGGERDAIEGLQLGTIETTIVANPTISAWNKKVLIWDMPFLFRDYEHAVKAVHSDIEKDIMAELEKDGIMELGAYVHDVCHIYTTKKPIYTLEDMQGVKIRTMESPVQVDYINALGAMASPIAQPELYTALQQGVVEGSHGSTFNFWTSNHQDMCKYYTLTSNQIMPAHFLMSKKFYDTLPEDIQEMILRLGNEVMMYAEGVARRGADDKMELMKEVGIEIIEITEEERAKFRAKVQPVYDKWDEELGELVDRVAAMK